MREIKFRAWHKGHKSMVHFDWDKVAKDQYQTQHLCALLSGNHSDGVAMQYTGLKDANGVEIYEGDIAIWRINGKERIGEVYYDCQAFDMRNNVNGYGYIGWDSLRGEIEVIGNIHENKELMA